MYSKHSSKRWQITIICRELHAILVEGKLFFVTINLAKPRLGFQSRAIVLLPKSKHFNYTAMVCHFICLSNTSRQLHSFLHTLSFIYSCIYILSLLKQIQVLKHLAPSLITPSEVINRYR